MVEICRTGDISDLAMVGEGEGGDRLEGDGKAVEEGKEALDGVEKAVGDSETGDVEEKDVVDGEMEEGELETVAEVKACHVRVETATSGEEEVDSEGEEQLPICVQATLARLRRQNRRLREERAQLRVRVKEEVKEEVKEVREVWGCTGCTRLRAKVMEVKGKLAQCRMELREARGEVAEVEEVKEEVEEQPRSLAEEVREAAEQAVAGQVLHLLLLLLHLLPLPLHILLLPAGPGAGAHLGPVLAPSLRLLL